MMEPTQISCIVLSYNGGKCIIPTLESCKLQTYPYKDLVIADDHSTDNGYTVSIIENWVNNNNGYFKNILFIKNPQNLGIVKNVRNASLHAMGDILFGLGQGDLCYGPKTLEVMAKQIQYQRNNGEEDPYFWLGEYMGYKIEHNKLTKIQLYKDLPHQHKLLITNPDKSLKQNLSGWEIGGVGIIYHKKFYHDSIYPLFNAPKNWEDGPTFIWALAENRKIGILNMKLRWYEVGSGISWQNSKSQISLILEAINILQNKKTPSIMAKTTQYKELCNWLQGLKTSDSKMKKILNDYSLFLKSLDSPILFQRISFVLKKFFYLMSSSLNKIISIIYYKILPMKETPESVSFELNKFLKIDDL